MHVTSRVAWLSAAILILHGAELMAQSTRQPAWEVEVHGGGIASSMPSSGDFALPAPEATTAPAGGRPVPSWYFGDGSSQLNQFPSVRILGQLVPLDGTLQRKIVERPSGGTVGLRVARRFARRWSADLTVDYGINRLALTDDTDSALEAARASFVTAFNNLMSFGLFASHTVNSTLVSTDRHGRQIITTGSVLFDVMPASRLAPYVAVGAGAVSNLGTPPSAVLTGAYQFTLNTPFPGPLPAFSQIDTLTVRSSVESGAVWLVGGGVKYPVARHWAVRLDVRDYMGRSTISTRIEASPTTPPSQFGSLTMFSSPGSTLVFSGTPFLSTLSIPLREFTTFTATGVQHQISVTGGVSWRF